MSGTDTMASSSADIRTAKAQGYLIQLCKHFAHKIPATYADNRGCITFDMGVADLDATDTGVLNVVVSARDAEKLPVLEDVVERHLKRFAFKEELAVAWVQR
jgi:uncharacterized protein